MTNVLTTRPRVAVLGAGIAGLTAALLLSERRDVDVDLLEALPVPGGRANVVDGAEHCQRLFLDDYHLLLEILDTIPHAGTTIRRRLVPMPRYVDTPSAGWIEISHQYTAFAGEVSLADKVRMMRASRRSLLAVRRVHGETNFLGAPKNHYSPPSMVAVARTLVRRQRAFALPGASDVELVDPWLSALARRGVDCQLGMPVDRVDPDVAGVDIHVCGERLRYDAAISTLFASSLIELLDASGISHHLPRLSHAHCPTYTIAFSPEERAPRIRMPGIYSASGIGIVVQPSARRCVVLCIRTARRDHAWIESEVVRTLQLTHRPHRVRFRPNDRADEALYIGGHIERSRVLAVPAPRFAIAGSWTRNRYPVDSGESAARSARAAVRAVRHELGLSTEPAPAARLR